MEYEESEYEEDKQYFYQYASIDKIKHKYFEELTYDDNLFLFFSKKASNYIEMKHLKFHICFDNFNPFIYVLPYGKTIGFALHSQCVYCAKWLEFFLDKDNLAKKTLDLILDKVFKRLIKIIIVLYPKIQYLSYFEYDDIKESSKYFIKNTNINIGKEGKGNIYACAAIKDYIKGNSKQKLDKLLTNLKENMIWIVQEHENVLLKRLSLLKSFGGKLKDYKDIIPINGYNRLDELNQINKEYKLDLAELIQHIKIKYGTKHVNTVYDTEVKKKNGP